MMMRNALNSRRSRTSCSLIALATVLAVGATPAAAQSFDGSGTFFTNGAGSANINNSVANTTTVTLNGGQTIIDWVPNDNSVSPGTPITFQPAGTTALFTSTQDFAVLNRINQTDITRAITMNGTVNARVGGVQRGSVYFYSPGGFIFGGGSVFSVGSLVVTASPITLTGNNFINGADNTVVFGQAPNSNAAIVNNGTINASMAPVGVLPPGGSYVAMVAPRVIHHGSITVNGSAALVAAEEATINFSPDGLFDIQMTVGTDDPNGVHVTGDIGGVASTGVDDKQRIFLATVPKNDAVTMLVTNGAQLGFDIAGAADIDGNAIVLSAGHNIANGVADMFTDVGSGADANINIQNSDFTSAVFGTATGFADVSAAGDISEFASDLTLRAVDQSFISSSGTGGLLDIAGNLDVSLDVFGEQDGQSVTAGHGALYADGDGAITVDGNVSMTANGFGANSTTAGVHAGNGTGGFVQVQGQGSGGSVTIAGNLFMQADGFGGDPGIAGINAGNGTGGSIYIGTFGNGSSLDVVGTVAAFADGFGGDGNGTSLECFGCNGLGGMGLGGTVQVRTDTATGSTASFGGLVTLSARGEGGESGSAGNPSALGDGGFIGIGSAGGGTLTFTTDVSADAGGMGGDSHIPGIAAGNGIGDTITISADAGSTLLFQGSLLAVANGDGGVVNTGVNGGNGTGGVINVIANGLDGKVTFEKGANLFADGNASDLVGDCLSCGALGGDGFGGSVLFSGTSGGLIETPGTLALSAAGWGGTGVTGAAGNGTGGGVLVSASTGVTINVAGNLQADASGNGGFNIGGFAAGNGTGGTAGIQANGGHVTVTGNVQFGASGFGGNSQGGDGGNGTGGLAGILTTGATASLLVGGNVLLEASGSGGSSFNDGPLGDGGDGFGGRTRAVAEDGSTQTGDIENPSIHVLGNLVLDATATGGTGANGGNAVGRTTPPNNEGADPAAFIFATLATAELQVDGLTNIDVSATGGEGFDGIGGNATAGEIDVASQQGDVLLSDFIGNAEAHGGAGSFGGGAGGNATGGNIDVAWSILAGAPLTGTISADTVALSVNGYGGAGGDGTDANTGGDAGAGGSGTGGNVLLAGNAAGGTLNVGATTILADGYGGIGGSGGNGDTGSGGNGAAGGTGTGGFIQAGTISSESHPGSGGTTTFTTLNVSASASGGAGGDGGIGGGGTGSGGHGGDAVGGEADFFVRGIAVTADSVNLFANATGGNGGAGSPAGNGGDALAGFISVESKDRVGSPLQRGSLTADSIAGTAIAQGGSGNVDGTSTVRGGSYFRVLNGDATIGSLSFVFAGDQYDGSLGPNYIQAQDGTATLGTFSYDTTGELAIYTTSTGSLDVGNMFLVAGNFIDHPTLPGPASPGTIFADNLSVTSGGDFFADANIDVLNGIDITVPGSIQFNQALSPSFIDLWAQGGSITLDGIDTDGTLNLLAAGPINTDAILAGLTVDIHSQTGSVDIGNLDAGGDVSLIAGTFIAGQDVTTGGNIFAQTASGDIGLQNLSGHDVVLDSGNAIDVIGQIDASGNVTLTADSSIALTGALSALGNANLDAGTGIGLGGAVDVGGNALMTAGADIDYVTLLAGGSVNAAAGGGIAGGSIGAGGDIGLGAGNAIALTGNVAATGNIDLTAGTLITGLDFTAGGSIDMDAGAGSITVDNLVGGSFVHLDAGADINLAGVVDAGADVFMTAGLDIAYVTIDAGDSVNAAAGGGLAGGSIGSGGDVGLGAGDAIALTGNVTAAGSIGLTAGTGITGLDFTAGGSIGMVTDAGSINVDNLVGGSFVQLDAGADILVETINSGGFIEAISGADILLSGDIQADGDIDLNAAGHIDMNNGISGESLELDAGGAVLALNLTGGDSVEIDAVGSVTTGNISAGLVNPSSSPDADYFAVIRAGGAIATGNIDAAQNIGLATPGTITTANIDAGGIFMALGHGNMLFGDATASEVFLADFAALVFGGGGGGGGLANCVGTCGTLGADGVVTAPPSGSFYSYLTTEGGVDGAGQLPGAGTAEGATNGSLYTTAFSAAAGDDLNFWFNYVTSDGSGFADYAWAALLTASLDPVATLFTARTQPSGTIVPGQGLPGVEATLNPASVPIIDGAPVWSPLGTSSGTCFDVGCGFTGWIGSTYEIANAGSYVLRFGVSNWTDTAYQSGMAFSGITIGGVPVATAAARTGGSITIGNVDTGMFTAAAGTTLTTGYINSGSSIDLGAGGAISTDNLFAGTYVLAEGGSITTGNIHAGSIDLTSTAGGIATQALLADGDIELDAFGNISFANADAGDEFDFSAGGSVTGGAVVAGNEISGDAGGSVTLGNLTAGLSDEDDFSIGIAAIGNITVGNADGPGAVGFATQGNLQTGNLSGGGLVMALVGGDTTINGSIATTGEGGGQVYMADDSMFITGGGTLDGEGDFDPAIVLALDPVATGGSITINGPVTTGLFEAAAGTSLTTQAITASDIHARAGGLATLNGVWNVSNQANLSSNDIDITATGGIDGGSTGEIALFSSNPTQMQIGDGLSGTGYALSNAEFGRISGADVTIIGRGDASAAIDMLIGDLTVTGSQAGSTIESADGVLAFAVGDIDTETASGVIRVAGDVNATGFGADNAIEFYASRFELDAATGSISIFSSGSTLGGEIGLYADRIHVASATILDQLAANPTYSGYQQDLNEAATVQRPEGVLRASSLWIESDNLQDILIQNTGTAATPAGFLVNEAFVNDDNEVAGPAGSINLIVNGQVVTEGGTLTGIEARDALIGEDTNITPFTANSTINGCPLTGACIILPPPPPPPPPTANVVDNQIDLITSNPLGDSEFGNEEDIDDNEEGDEGANNPISPPQPLFDTRPLIPSSDVNDPVSGTGNPALLGSDQCDENDDETQCGTEKEGDQ